MKIILLANYALDGSESMRRFARILEVKLQEYGHEVKIIRPNVYFGHLVQQSSTIKKWFGYIDKFIIFPLSFRNIFADSDIVHIIDHANSVYIPYLGNKPYLVTCHDTLAIESALGLRPEKITGKTGYIYQKWILSNLNSAKLIACVSKFTQESLLKISSLKKDEVKIILNGFNYQYSLRLNSKDYLQNLGINKPYILHVGGNQWYKNRLGVLIIFHKLLKQIPSNLSLKLIMVGKPLDVNLQNYINKYNLSSYIISLVSISNNDLEILYNCAEALIFPSLSEGFGWPVIEAQACGCPVVCSNKGALPEIVGDSALMASANDYKKLASHLHSILTDSRIRKVLIQKGLDNVNKFNSERMIQQYCNLYKSL